MAAGLKTEDGSEPGILFSFGNFIAISSKSSLTFMDVFADVSIKSIPFSLAYPSATSFVTFLCSGRSTLLPASAMTQLASPRRCSRWGGRYGRPPKVPSSPRRPSSVRRDRGYMEHWFQPRLKGSHCAVVTGTVDKNVSVSTGIWR